MAHRVVYVDLVFLFDAMADLLTFWAVGVWLQLPLRSRYLLAAAMLGGLGAVAVALRPGMPVLTAGLVRYVAAPLVLLALAHWPALAATPRGRRLRRLGQLLGGYYAAAFLAAGGTLALLLSASGGGLAVTDEGVTGGLIPAARGWGELGLLTGLVAGGYLVTWARTRHQVQEGRVVLHMAVGDGPVRPLPSLIDTGNHLMAPMSGRPVIVLDPAAAKLLLPEPVAAALRRGLAGLADLPAEWAAGVVPVPFRSVGQAGGLILAFPPRVLRLEVRGAVQGCRPALAAFAPEHLQGHGDFLALVPPDLLDPLQPPAPELQPQQEGDDR